MKKLLIAVGFVFVLLVAGLVVLATMDFNRLGKDHYYVQITTDGERERFVASDGAVYESYWYTLPAYNEKGEEQIVKFSAQKNLRKDAYLMLYLKKGDEVTSFDEVQAADLPEKVKEKLK